MAIRQLPAGRWSLLSLNADRCLRRDRSHWWEKHHRCSHDSTRICLDVCSG